MWTLLAAMALASDPDPSETDPGRVCFFRTKRYIGMAVKFGVRDGGYPLGAIAVGHYFCDELEAGEHTIEVGAVGGALLVALEVANEVARKTSEVAAMIPRDMSGVEGTKKEIDLSVLAGHTHFVVIKPGMLGTKVREVERKRFDRARPKAAKGYTPGAEATAPGP